MKQMMNASRQNTSSRNTHTHTHIFAALAAAGLTVCLCQPLMARANPRYRVIDLTPLGFYPDIELNGMMGLNNQGEVVYGRQVDENVFHIWIWLPQDSATYGLDKGYTDLTALDEENPGGIAHDINESGLIATQIGRGTIGWIGDEAAIWQVSGGAATITGLGLLTAPSGKAWTGAFAVNNSDPPLVVGMGGASGSCDCPVALPLTEGVTHGFKVDFDPPQGALIDLDSDASVNCVAAIDVLTPGSGTLRIGGGQFCAQSIPCTPLGEPECQPRINAVSWTTGTTAAQLNALDSGVGSFVRALDDSAHASGWSRTDECTRRAVYWDSITATPEDMGMPAGQTDDPSRAEGMNNLEYPQVVGWDDVEPIGVLWEQQSNSTWVSSDLNTIYGRCNGRWLIFQAHDINDSGWIAAVGLDQDESSAPHALLLVPYESCIGDVNNNGVVDIDDMLLVINAWGPCADPDTCCADVVETGVVDIDDLLAVINGWGDCDYAGSLSRGAASGEGSPALMEILEGLPGMTPELLEQIGQLIGD